MIVSSIPLLPYTLAVVSSLPDFMPHGFCYLWDPLVLWLNVISDGLIALSYYCIPVVLIYFIRRNRSLPVNALFWMFATFILACGTTHVMEVWNIWHANYLVAGLIKALTATVSVVTAAMLIPLAPTLISVPERIQLQDINRKLREQIAERMRVENALRVAQDSMSGIIASAMDSIITVDEQQQILLFNAAAEKMFRCSARDALGQSIERFIPPRFRAAHSGHVHQFGKNGVTSRAMGELRALWAQRADGEEFQVEASISQVEAAGQKMFTVILRDISDRLHAAEARELLATVVDSSDDAIISKTLQGNISSWNVGAEKVFGYCAAEVLGKPALLLFPPDRVQEEAEILARIGRGECVKHYETVRVRKNGQKIDVSVTISPLRDGTGKIVGASKVARDISESKRVQAALREKERVLSEAQRIARLGSWSYEVNNPTATMIWSDEMYRIYGVAPDTFSPGMESLLEMVVRQDRPAMLKWHAACLAGEKPGELQFRLTRPDGTIRFVSRRGELLYDVEGRPVRVAGSAQDITESKLAEAALRDSEERFQGLVNGIPQLAWMAEPDGHIIWYNQRWYEYTGTTAQEMEGWGWQKVHDPEALPKVLERWKNSIANGTAFEMEFPLRAADGHLGMFLTRIVPLKDSTNKVMRWFGTSTDISERKRAEERQAELTREVSQRAEELAHSREALEAQTVMFEQVLESMGEGLVAADLEGRFLLWNEAAKKMMGRPAADLPIEQWTPHYQVFLPDGITPYPPDRLPLVRALQGESVQAELIVQKPGAEAATFMEVSARPMKDARGDLSGGVATLRDITKRKAAEQEIQELNRTLEQRVLERTTQLQAANQELEAFTYSVSHDLRAPLRHIAGFTGLLVEEYSSQLDPEAQRHLQRIQAGTRKMGQLVDELLSLARIGRQSANLQAVELDSMVEEVITLLKPDWEGRAVDWKITSMPRVMCDPTLMKQVFQNLLSNALKYSRPREHSLVEVGATEINGQRVIFVRDNGVGFNMKYSDKLFGVFQRLHRADEFEGTGVGLAIVHRIIKKHGGRIWAEAELDKGATFYFTVGAASESGDKSLAAGGGKGA